MRAGARVSFWAGALLAIAAVRCSPEGSSGPPAHEAAPLSSAAPAPDPLAPLHAFEEARRASADFAHLPPSDRAFGPDPAAIKSIPGKSPARYAGLLRGRDAVVILDDKLEEVSRAPAPPSPTGIAIADGGEIFVSGEASPIVSRYRADRAALRHTGDIALDGAREIRDVAIGGSSPEVLYAVDQRTGRLLALALGGARERREIAVGHGAFRVMRAGDRVLVDRLLDHAITIFRLDARGLPIEDGAVTIHHDGPIWGFDAVATPEGLIVAAGGVEDHPLDRTEGSFGYIDSFAFLYRIAPGAAAAERLAEINVSALGAITPKAIALRETKIGLTATIAGAGGDRILEIAWGADLKLPLATTARPIVPGVAMLAIDADGAVVFADPLLDGWGRIPAGAAEAPQLVPAKEDKDAAIPPRSVASRVGEALFFTKLMAPWNSAEGRLSRFTCETCHFEGTIDGRTHHTGRGDIRATTKPLLGLFNNRPHFSRALDPDMATMVNNEFRVAGALSGHDPWFAAPEKDLPWIDKLGATESDLGPEALRKALMTFLMELTHRPNPAVIGRSKWSPEEREGAAVFRDRCERCHSARLASDIESSAVGFEGWEALIFSREGPIVWGRSGYEKTGVMPYVNERGARVPSLRRVYRKWPYFTNGVAKSLGDVLDRVRFGASADGAAFAHDGAQEGGGLVALSDQEKKALLAFLDLL